MVLDGEEFVRPFSIGQITGFFPPLDYGLAMAEETLQIDDISARKKHILEATLDLVATEGLLKTTISKISNRAKCSPGIVYHYFQSKDEIVNLLYVSIFKEKMDETLAGYDPSLPCLERYKRLWVQKYRYHADNPNKTAFVEQFKNSSFYTDEMEQETSRLLEPLTRIPQHDIEAGYVEDLPLGVIYTMTLTVAFNLAREHSAGDTRLDEGTLNAIAERVCTSVLA